MPVLLQGRAAAAEQNKHRPSWGAGRLQPAPGHSWLLSPQTPPVCFWAELFHPGALLHPGAPPQAQPARPVLFVPRVVGKILIEAVPLSRV